MDHTASRRVNDLTSQTLTFLRRLVNGASNTTDSNLAMATSAARFIVGVLAGRGGGDQPFRAAILPMLRDGSVDCICAPHPLEILVSKDLTPSCALLSACIRVSIEDVILTCAPGQRVAPCPVCRPQPGRFDPVMRSRMHQCLLRLLCVAATIGEDDAGTAAGIVERAMHPFMGKTMHDVQTCPECRALVGRHVQTRLVVEQVHTVALCDVKKPREPQPALQDLTQFNSSRQK